VQILSTSLYEVSVALITSPDRDVISKGNVQARWHTCNPTLGRQKQDCELRGHKVRLCFNKTKQQKQTNRTIFFMNREEKILNEI
jgi:hypothetical protein